MRPPVGVEASLDRPVRSRKSSADFSSSPTPAPTSAPTGPTTFFLRTEKELEESIADSDPKPQDSSYGVESLADTLEAAFGDKAAERKDKELGDRHSVDKGFRSSGGSERRGVSSPSPKSKEKRLLGNRNTTSKDSPSPPSRPLAKNASPSLPNHPRRTSNGPISDILSSFQTDSPAPNSTIPDTPRSISMKSFRLSDEESVLDEIASQAIMSSDEEDEGEETRNIESKETSHHISTSMPQLVMPSIQMPKRRPFTTQGKHMGRLKVLVAGNTGVGKSSLIRSIVQMCEDIVHVDPLTSASINSTNPPSPTPRPRRKSRKHSSTTTISEIHASTKAYPSWWSEALDSHSLQRRSSTGDTILERNLCFIDTPGLDHCAKNENMESILGYMENLLRGNCAIGSMADADLLATLSGSGGVQVDLILYLFSHDLENSKEIENFKLLSQITNVLPLISHADKLHPQQISSLKNRLLSHFHLSSIRPFLFGRSVEDISKSLAELKKAEEKTSPESQSVENNNNTETTQALSSLPPFAISSKLSSDSETMDASLLMSSDYIQPLVVSDLDTLIRQILDPENMAWLRHASSKKFLQWRNRLKLDGDFSPPRNIGTKNISAVQHPFSVNAPSSNRTTTPNSSASSLLSSPSPSHVLVPQKHSPFYALSEAGPGSGTPTDFLPSPLNTDFALTRFGDHSIMDDQYSHLSLAKWATDLQRSLRNERERFAQLEHSQRAQWLLERVGDEVKQGRIVSAEAITAGTCASSPPSDAEWAVVRHGRTGLSNKATNWAGISLDPRDPLGICDFGDGLKRSGVVLFGAGVVGAMCYAVVKVLGEDGFTWVGPEGLWAMFGGTEGR